MDKLAETFKDFKINDTEYYVLNIANVNDAKGDPASDPTTVTHTSDGEGNVTYTSNRILQQRLLSNRTLPIVPVVVPDMDPRIDNRITTMGGASNTILTHATKEVVADVTRGSVRVNRNPRHVSQTGRDNTIPCDTGLAVSYKPVPPSVLIGIPTIYPACETSGRSQVGKKRQSTSPDEVRNAQKLDTTVDRKFPNDQDYASIFRRVIGHELSQGSSDYLYLSCLMNFSSNIVQSEAPQFVDLGLPAVNTSNEFCIISTPATRIRSPKDGSHWSAPDHVFGEATAVGISGARSDQYYSYKTHF